MTNGKSELNVATARLERAMTALESRINAMKARASHTAGELFDQDRARLAAELDACRARETALLEAAREASEALGAAVAEVRALIEQA